MIGDFIEVNGEHIPKDKAMALIRMLCNHAKQIAGDFHGQKRSDKFRANWPNEDVFAECNWRSFVEAVRADYARLLGEPNVREDDKHHMFLAVVLWDMVDKASPEKFGGNQILPNTQQFEGDKRENRKIVENFGKQSNTFKELLMGSTRYH